MDGRPTGSRSGQSRGLAGSWARGRNWLDGRPTGSRSGQRSGPSRIGRTTARIGRATGIRWPRWWIVWRAITGMITRIVAAPPIRIAVVITAATGNRADAPTHSPTPIAVAARRVADGHANCNANTEGNDRGGDNGRGAIPRSNNGCAVDNRRIICWNVDDLRIGGLDDDDLWTFLDYLDFIAGP